MKKLPLALCMALTIFATGCAYNSGSRSMESVTASEVQKSVIEGKTKKSEVQAKYGQPSTVETFSGGERWIYQLQYGGTNAAGMIPYVGPLVGETTYNVKTLTIEFDKRDIARKVEFADTRSVGKSAM